MKTSQRLLLIILAFYLVGPTLKIGGATLQDMLFFLYFIFILLSGDFKLPLRNRVFIYFVAPSLIILLSVLGKLFIGLPLSSDDSIDFIKKLSLGLLTLSVVKVMKKATESEWQKFIESALKILALATIYICVLGIIQYLRPAVYEKIFGGMYAIELRSELTNLEVSEEFGRISSLFHWANALGVFLVFSLTTIVVNRKNINNLLFLVTMTVGMLALLLTNSRVSMILFGFSLVYVAFIERKKRFLLGFGILVLLLIIILPLDSILSPDNIDRLQEIIDFITRGDIPVNVEVRLSTFSYLAGLLLKSQYFYFGFPQEVYWDTIALSADNQYLGWFIKYGSVSILLTIWLIRGMWISYRVIRNKVVQQKWLSMTHSFFLVNALILIGGMSQDTLFINRWREFYFIFFGCILTYVLNRKNVTEPHPIGSVR